LEAAAGFLKVAVDNLLDELVLSFPPARNVLSIPPLFSGLGVREPFRCPVDDSGASIDDEDGGKADTAGCKGDLRERGTSVPELAFEV
jgi:hypothetical protein